MPEFRYSARNAQGQLLDGTVMANDANPHVGKSAKNLERVMQIGYPLRMPMTIEQIADEALALPSEQRAMLVDRLVESLDAAEANRIDKLWVTEVKRRRDEVRGGLVRTIPGDEAMARVRRSLGR